MRFRDWSSDVCSSDLVEVSFGLLPLMSATCFDPWFTDANSSPFFRCCVLCDPWFSVCHSCRSQACNANLIFQIACETFARFVCSLENRFFRRCFTPEGPIAVEVGIANLSEIGRAHV